MKKKLTATVCAVLLFIVVGLFLLIVHFFWTDHTTKHNSTTETTITEESLKKSKEILQSQTENNAEKSFTVYIETGHGIGDDGKWDAGCSWSNGDTTYEEAKVMIPIAQAMTKYLEKAGVKVLTDANSNNNKNLTETLNFLEKHPVDAFVNLHCDWEESESGTMALYKTDEQKKLAEALNKGVHQEIDIPDRGLTSRDDLDTLNSDQPNCPACLYETGSIKADNETLTKHADEYGKGLAKGMCLFLGVEYQ